MGFQQGLSGLSVSSKALDAIGNNVANAGTVGFKQSQVQFADIYAASMTGSGATQIGIGAFAPSIAQQFTQGNLTVTQNPLDIAINGQGMFRLSSAGTVTYSRNGQFQLDKDGYIVNSGGLHLTGFAADATGAIAPGDPVDLRVSTSNIAPRATTASQVQVNLDSRATPPTTMTHGTLTGSATPPTLTIGAGNDNINIIVDGRTAATVTIPNNTYATASALADAVETAINNDPTLRASNSLVDVAANASGALYITSRSVGTVGSVGNGSTVALAAVPGDGAVNLLGAAPTAVSGADNFNTTQALSYTASTSQTVYDSLGNAQSLTMYFAKTSQPNRWQLYTGSAGQATGSAAPTLTYTVGAGNNEFSATLDGLSTQTITMTGGPYTTAAALAAAVQSAINGNATFQTAGRAVDVTVGSSGSLVVTSRTKGPASSVTLAAVAGDTGLTEIFGASPTSATGVLVANTMLFSTSGALQTPASPLTHSMELTTGAVSPLTFSLDFTGSTQYGVSFGVNNLGQDGYTSGRLSGLSVTSDGIVQGRYSNGKTRNMGQLLLANFNNPNGLMSMGGNQWAETSESGQPIPGTPGTGALGVVQSAAVEESNVDLTAELVAMITQQRAYQANAQTIKTQDSIQQTLINLR